MQSGAIDLRARPPVGAFLSQRMFGSSDREGRPGIGPAVFARRGYTLPASVEEQSVDVFFEEMDRAGIANAAVMARIPNVALGETSNESVGRIVADHPERFLGIGCVRLSESEAETDLDDCRRLGFLGVAVEPGVNDAPMRIDDAALYPIYEQISSLGLPAFITGGDANPDISYASPVTYDRVARDFPDLSVVAVHGGWPWVTEMLGVAWRRPNVWVMPDLYWVNLPGQADYTIAANGFLQDRMVFGTSYPAVNLEQYVSALRQSGVTDATWHAISEENPRRLLGLEEDEVGGGS